MKTVSIFLSFLILVGCTDKMAENPSFEVDSSYDIARRDLLNAGWEPIPADCSGQPICPKGKPELLKQIDTGFYCGSFVRKSSKIRVCAELILDGWQVKSVQTGA